MKTRIFLLSIFTVMTYYSFAQTRSGLLKGSVMDSIGKTNLPGSSVFLSGQKDSGVIAQTTADLSGNYRIKNILPGDYILKVEHIGYEPKSIKITIAKDVEINAVLVRSKNNLDGLTVFSKKPIVTQTPDKITLNVSEGAISSSDNLYNIVSKIPGVTQSRNSLYYQGKPLIILLDNKMNNMSGDDLKEYLSGVLGTSVDKIEILLNPSSKYDAQGGAVFNIKTQRNRNYGLMETISAGAGSGTYPRNSLGYSFNYRDSTVNIYGGYDFNHAKQFFLLNAHETFNANPASINLIDDNTRTQNNHSLRVGIDYDINPGTSIGFLFKGFQNYRHRSVTNISVYNPGISIADTVANVNTTTNAIFTSPSINVFFKTRTGKKGSELMITGDYFGYKKSWSDDFTNVYTDLSGHAIAPARYLLDRSPANNSIKSFEADYSEPFKGGKWEAGVKVTDAKTDNDALWQELISNIWTNDAGKTNRFIYTETVYASYFSFNKHFLKWNVQGGVRYEATQSVGNSVTLNSVTENKYENLFPSMLVQYSTQNGQVFTANYRSSIQRFGFDIINPFIVFQSQYSYNQGNPNIKPSFFNSVDISYSYKGKLLAGIGYSSVRNPIYYGYKKDATANTVIGSYFNFSSAKLFTANIIYTLKLFNGKLTSINAASFLHSSVPDFSGNIQQYSSYSLNTTNSILLPAKISIETNIFYNSPSLDGTVRQASIFGISTGIAKPILKAKGSLKLSCADILNTQISHFFSQGDGIILASDWKVESRFVNLLFTYKFGNQNVKANKNRKTAIEEEKKRMGAN